jgi:hypothetical protein
MTEGLLLVLLLGVLLPPGLLSAMWMDAVG